jgi:hypothetical protein
MRIESQPPQKRRWRWWAIVLLNVAGLVVIIPLLRVTIPLMGVWWHTRSQASLATYQQHNSKPASASSTAASGGNDSANASTSDGSADLKSLSSKATTIDSFSQKELQELVAKQFGVNARSAQTSGKFDLDSAVFDSISKTTIVFNGSTYYGYRVNLVDQNGNHKTNIDCYTEPNLDYERSMAAMELINGSPQLKRIYQAMAPSLAEKSSSTNSADPKSGSGPAFRLDSSGK